MELLLWILLPIAAVIVIHHYEKKQGYQKERISAELELQTLWSVASDSSDEVYELRSIFNDLEKQIPADDFRFVGATKNAELGFVCLHYLSYSGDIVLSLSEKTIGKKGEKMVEIGSETTSGEFHVTSDVIENINVELPAALNNHYVGADSTISEKLDLHRTTVNKYELKEIDGIADIAKGVNRMHSILQAHQISMFY